MTVQFDGVRLFCDLCLGDKPIEMPDHLTAVTSIVLRAGSWEVILPPKWSKDGDLLICPVCTERRAIEKSLSTQVPAPTLSPALSAVMREVVRADIEDRNISTGLPEMQDFLKHATSGTADSPDFFGHVDVGEGRRLLTVVYVRGNAVKITWPGERSMSLTLQRDDFLGMTPPAFVDLAVWTWVKNCLRTMDAPTPLLNSVLAIEG